MRKDDPCMPICEFDGRSGWCAGCGVTVAELRSWKKLTPYKRGELLRLLPRRVSQLNG
ncbi:MAG: DUF1289 domain-containing protein [Alphaproteobacteria bacterium]|nr:DUF1289 domain-containing protein [Alphaproteobacteria bacterium]MBU1559767.1 DUF1289 domain-containing protein [Alphaproteobacteria bacterium]MBU2305146.1 DUF1289 domain-containing protein [Alphaproteobacteria bacterium]MBU2367951.1 DUF1289 domain-containing protein [Alphaproteobacteria bacterium]